jgi:hypothetical protein
MFYVLNNMQAKLNNPFLVAGYHGPAYFCYREAEVGKIISANQQIILATIIPNIPIPLLESKF